MINPSLKHLLPATVPQLFLTIVQTNPRGNLVEGASALGSSVAKSRFADHHSVPEAQVRYIPRHCAGSFNTNNTLDDERICNDDRYFNIHQHFLSVGSLDDYHFYIDNASAEAENRSQRWLAKEMNGVRRLTQTFSTI